MSLATFLLVTMLAWRAPTLPELPYFEEVAHDVADVAMDPKEAPVFAGPLGRERTALLLLSIAFYESGGFARDVDQGRKLGDGGRSHCLMQVWLRKGESVPTRGACMRLGLSRVRESFALCHAQSSRDWLGGYVRGHCGPGDEVARRRWDRARSWWTGHKGEFASAPALASN